MKAPVTIMPGIYQLAIPMPDNPLGYLLAYLVEAQDAYLLIDTGWNTSIAWSSLLDQLQQLNISLGDINKMLVTHAHPDHLGLAGKIKQDTGALLYLHEEDAKLLNTRYENVEELLEKVRNWLIKNGAPPAELKDLSEASMPVLENVFLSQPDVLLKGGEKIPTALGDLTAIWTPGHSPGETCFYLQSKKILFSGDHLLPTVTPNIGSHPQNMDNPLGKYLDSLNKVEHLEVGLVLPAHEFAFTDMVGRIKELRQHHLDRMKEIAAQLSGQPKTAYEISASLKWGPGTWEELSGWHRRMAMLEVLAHLEYMKRQGTVDKTESGWIKLKELIALRDK